MKLLLTVVFAFVTMLVSLYAHVIASLGAQNTRGDSDPGVDVGIVQRATALFEDPDPNSEKIGPLKPGEWTILVSRQVTNDWLNVIQLSSGRQGWVLSDRIRIRYTQHPNEGVDLQTQATGTDAPPVIDVQNNSDSLMYLHIEGEPEISIGQHGEQDVSVAPGVWTYNASAAGVIPLFGNKAFVTGDRYTWSFWIGNQGGRNSSNAVDPSLKAEAQQLQTEITSENASLKVTRQLLDAEQTALNSQDSKVQSDQADVDTKRQSLDQTDQSAVDEFNSEVDSVNAELDAYQTALQRYNEDVAAYNARLDSLNALQDRLERIADTINRE